MTSPFAAKGLVSAITIALFVSLLFLYLLVSWASGSYNSAFPGDDTVKVFSSGVRNETIQGLSPHVFCGTSLDCLEKTSQSLAVSFCERVQSSSSNVCPKSSRPKSYLRLIKVPKTGSSTLAGVVLRVARHYNASAKCHHITGSAYYKQHRNPPSNHFLLTSVRHPAKRALSHIFFHASLIKTPLTKETALKSLKDLDGTGVQPSGGRGGFQVHYISLDEIPENTVWNEDHPTNVTNPDAIQAYIGRIFTKYDFIVVQDRWDESLVALSFVLGTELSDILQVGSSKINAHDATAYALDALDRHRSCVALQQKFSTPAMQSYLASEEWRAMNYGDYLLYMAANASLDMTIQDIGLDRFQQRLDQYRITLPQIQKSCQNQTIFPCSDQGEFQMI